MQKLQRINLRIYQEQDPDLFEWLENLPGDRGAKASAIKAKLRTALSDPGQSTQAGTILNTESLLAELLPAMRRVVEKTVRHELDGLRLDATDYLISDGDTAVDDPLADKLDMLGTMLLDDNE
jgi:hypothetical protein